MIALTALVPLALLLSSVSATAPAPHREIPRAAGSHRESHHRRGAALGGVAVDEPVLEAREESLSLGSGIGAETLGWWLADSSCQGSAMSACIEAVGKNFASSWEDAKAPSLAKPSSSSSSSTSSHVSSSSVHSSSSHVSSTHSSSHVSSSSHASPTSHHVASSSHSTSSHRATPTPSSGSSGSSSGSCPARKRSTNSQFGFSSARFEINALKAHNDLRSQAGVEALTWSADLAATAASWATQCQWAKSNTTIGENLAAGYPNVASAVREWGSEPTSEQYAQALDAQVSAVGCSVRTCDFASQEPDVFDFGPVKYYVCAYDVAASSSA